MREVALFSGAGVTGINNNSYQVRMLVALLASRTTCVDFPVNVHQFSSVYLRPHCLSLLPVTAAQIAKGTLYNQQVGHGVSERCGFVKADFMHMPFPDASFDHAYAIDATCHAPDAVACYKVGGT